MALLSELLIDDHAALDKLLNELQAALRSSDLETAHAKLDLFWARLAVHIRAEHLHLFPIFLKKLGEEAQTVVAQLRQDHEFFMHQLALAIEIMRELLTLPKQLIAPEGLKNVKNIVLEVEERLTRHNEVEENQVYRWAATLLNSAEQAKLVKQITAELRNRPSRFTLSTWSRE